MNLELARAIIFVKDMPSMAAFYQDALGLTEVVTDDTSDGWRVLSAGGMQLALHAIPAQIAEGFAISVPPEARSSAVTKLVFRVPDVVAARAALHARGVIEVNQFFVDPDRSLVRCDFLDPEGNVFQISSE